MTSDTQKSRFDAVPDKEGRFGVYGGRFVAETLMSALAELETLYRKLSADPDFQRELDADLGHYVGRPSPLYEARRWSEQLGGARIFLKREEECLAACCGAPMMQVDHVYYENLTPERVDEILDGLE